MTELRGADPTGSCNYFGSRCLADLPLIRRHAEGGVALHMLHRGEVLADCQLDVGNGDVVKQIEPLPRRISDRTDPQAKAS